MADKNCKYVDDLLAECFACFQQGLLYDETGDTEDGRYMYERGLDMLKLAEKQKECRSREQYKNVNETRKKVEVRLKELGTKTHAKKENGAAEEKRAEKQNKINEVREQFHEADFPEAELIFFIPNGVQLFMIEGGSTTAPTCCNSLEIFRLSKQAGSSSNIPMDGFIRVGPWSYPLKAGAIPILKNEFGAYVMPNPVADHPDMFIGLLLPADLEENVEKQFTGVLKQYAEVRDQLAADELSKDERERLSDKISNMLRKGGEKLASGMTRAAEKTSAKLAEHSAKRRSNIIPNEKPTHVHPVVQKGVNCVHEGSKTIAKLTHHLLEKLGDVSVAAGQSIASGAEKTFGNGKGGSAVNGTINVLGSGIVGASTVWIGMEEALTTLCKSVANETVQTVKQKYGDDASEVTHKVLSSAGSTTMVVHHFHELAPRAIIDGAARQGNKPCDKDSEDRGSVTSLDAEPKKALDKARNGTNSEQSTERCSFLEKCQELEQPT